MATHPARARSRVYLLLGVIAFVVVALAIWWLTRPTPEPPKGLFAGSSSDLRQTVIVPTLDTPIPDGKSAIWCSSFQLAWNQFKSDLALGPIQLANAETIAERLNRAEQSAEDLSPGSYYVAAGLTSDGVRDRILREMREQFPNAPQPDLPNDPSAAAIAFAYLQAEAKYDQPFLVNPEKFRFKGGTGEQHEVQSFGLPRSGKGNRPQREQIEVLFWSYEDQRETRIAECALDLCKHSQPNQVCLGLVDKKQTLAEMLLDLEDKTAHFTTERFEHAFDTNDKLLVPTMRWRIQHRFAELEGADKQLMNPSLRGLYLGRAQQIIEFQIDATGATVASGADMVAKSRHPRAFHFDRPYLIYLKQRSAKHPFFVMWVENAELMQRFGTHERSLLSL